MFSSPLTAPNGHGWVKPKSFKPLSLLIMTLLVICAQEMSGQVVKGTHSMKPPLPLSTIFLQFYLGLSLRHLYLPIPC